MTIASLKSCPDCTHALADATWPGYNAHCPDCDVRAIANCPPELRQERIEQIESQCGRHAAQEVRRRVTAEVNRIRVLADKSGRSQSRY
jgi:hypothetical protein